MPMSVKVEPAISTGLQSGVVSRHRDRAASAASAQSGKPLKRLVRIRIP